MDRKNRSIVCAPAEAQTTPSSSPPSPVSALEQKKRGLSGSQGGGWAASPQRSGLWGSPGIQSGLSQEHEEEEGKEVGD